MVKTWKRKGYEVHMIEFDYDLKAFEVDQDGIIQTIYPSTLEDMEEIIRDLDGGEDVHGWEDGLGGQITLGG